MNLLIGDKVSFIVNATKFAPRFDKTIMFALMTAQMDILHLDFDREQVLFRDEHIPFEYFGLNSKADAANYTFNFFFEVSDIYDEANGKYGAEWGHVSFVDCNFVFESVLESMKAEIDPTIFISPDRYETVIAAITSVQNYIEESGITMCGISMEIDAKLT